VGVGEISQVNRKGGKGNKEPRSGPIAAHTSGSVKGLFDKEENNHKIKVTGDR